MPTTPKIKEAILNWMNQRTPEQLETLANQQGDMVQEIKPFAPVIKMYKTMNRKNIVVDPDELMDDLLNRLPEHGKVCFIHRQWYDNNIERLTTFVQNL